MNILELLEQIKTNEKGSHKYEDAIDAIQEAYSYGKCISLAIALHRVLNCEIVVSVNVVNDQILDIAHAWVVHNNKALDIMGYYEKWDSEELTAFGAQTIRGFDECKLNELYYGLESTTQRLNSYSKSKESDLTSHESEIMEALSIVSQYLLPSVCGMN